MSRQDQLHQLEDQYLRCRAFGHAWTGDLQWGAQLNGQRYKGWSTEHKTCDRCAASVLTIYDGQLYTQQISRTYPDGYLLEAGADHGYRVEARYEILRRSKP
jgi:hypothetical protein